MDEFIKEILKLAVELEKASGFHAVVIADDMRSLYKKHFDKVIKNYCKESTTVTEYLLNDRQKLLDAIPQCPVHGPCIPHALEWIEQMKNVQLLYKDVCSREIINK